MALRDKFGRLILAGDAVIVWQGRNAPAVGIVEQDTLAAVRPDGTWFHVWPDHTQVISDHLTASDPLYHFQERVVGEWR